MNRSSSARRIPFIRTCILRAQGKETRALMCNLSTAGAYVGLEPIPNVGDIVTMEFTLPGNDIPLLVDAQFIWRNPTRKSRIHSLPVGGGARFVGLGVKERRRLERFIADYIPPIR